MTARVIIHGDVALLPKDASVNLLADMLKQSEEDKQGLLKALKAMLLAYEGDAGETDSPACIDAREVIEKSEAGG